MASIELNALEIGSVQVSEDNRKIRIGIDSCAAVTVVTKDSGRKTTRRAQDTSGKAKSYRLASGKLLPDLGARKVQVKLKDGSLRCVNPRVADTHRDLMAVSEMNDMGHDVVFPRSDRGIKAYAYHEGSDTKLELERVNGVFELPFELVPYERSDFKIPQSTEAYTHRSQRLEQIGSRDAQDCQ